jgi:hypothetical protein
MYFVSSPRILEANEVRYKSQTEQGRRFARAAGHQARKEKGEAKARTRFSTKQGHSGPHLARSSPGVSNSQGRSSRDREHRELRNSLTTCGSISVSATLQCGYSLIATKKIFKFLRPAKQKQNCNPVNGFADKKGSVRKNGLR